MNYYEHHLGDYMRDTAHLSLLEDGAYRRLLDAYYIRERPLPVDLRECCKLARATSKPERDAVAYVLREFFTLADDGYHQARADGEIARFHGKQAKAKASADARWGAVRTQSERNANASVDEDAQSMRTHSERNANDMLRAGARPGADGHGRAPVPSNQSPVTKEKDKARASTAEVVARVPDPEGHQPTPAGLACRAMRKAGLQAVNPGDPRLATLLEQGVTADELAGVAAEAVGKGKGKGFAWVLAVVQSRRQEAAAIALAPPAPVTRPSHEADRTAEYLREQFRPITAEEKAKADEARKRAMAAVGRVA